MSSKLPIPRLRVHKLGSTCRLVLRSSSCTITDTTGYMAIPSTVPAAAEEINRQGIRTEASDTMQCQAAEKAALHTYIYGLISDSCMIIK